MIYQSDSHKGFVAVAAVAAAALLVAAGVYYLSAKPAPKANTSKKPIAASRPTVLPRNTAISPATDIAETATDKPPASPAAIPTDTPGWNTYRSAIMVFKFPANLVLEERRKGFIVLLKDAKNPQSVILSIDARLAGDYADFDKAVAAAQTTLESTQSENIAGGVKVTGKMGPGMGHGLTVTNILLKYGNAAVSAQTNAEKSEDLKLFDAIIATVIFQQTAE